MQSPAYKLLELFFIFIVVPISFVLEFPVLLKMLIGVVGFLYVIFVLLRVGNNQFKIGVGLNNRTGKPYTRPDAENPVDNNFFPSRIAFEKPNSSRLPEYLRADASAIYNFNLTPRIKATTGISVLNFINRKNILNRYYQINENDEIETVESISLGLTPNVSFRVAF